jgi:protein involved in polysaccharide export with SLBB domain
MSQPSSLAGALLLLVVPTLLAQSTANWDRIKHLGAGDRVRISLTGGRKLEGDFQNATEDAVMVDTSKSDETLNRAMVARVSLRGKSHRSRNALIGLGAGAGAGLILGVVIDSCRNNGSFLNPNFTICVVPANAGKEVLTPVGALLGLAVGAVIPTGGWRDLYRVK